MVLLKPVCMYLYGVLGLFWIFQLVFKKRKKFLEDPLLAFALSVSLLVGYCCVNKIQNDFFGVSTVSHDSSFANIIESNAYKTFTDKKLVSIIDSVRYHGTYYTLYYLNNDHDYMQRKYNIFFYPLHNGMKYELSIPPSPHGYTKKQLDSHIYRAMFTGVFWDYICRNYFTFLSNKLFYLPGFVFQLLLLIEICSIIFFAIYKDRILWLRLLLLLSAGGMILTFFLVGYGQIDRILIPVLPLLIIFVFNFIDDLLLWKQNFGMGSEKYLKLKLEG